MRRGRTFWKNVAKARPPRSIKCFQVCLASCEAKRGQREARRRKTKVDIFSRQKAGVQMERDAQITVFDSWEARRPRGTPAKQISSDRRPGCLSPLRLLWRVLRGPSPFFSLPSKVTHIMMTTAKWIATLLEWDKYRGRVVLFDLFLAEYILSRVKFPACSHLRWIRFSLADKTSFI